MTRNEIASLVAAAVGVEADYYSGARVWTKGGYVRVYVTDLRGRDAGHFEVERDGAVKIVGVKHATPASRIQKAAAKAVAGQVVVDEFAAETPAAPQREIDRNTAQQIAQGTLESFDA